MTDNSTIWKALQEHLPKRTWIPIAEVFATVQNRVVLDEEDLEHAPSPRNTPRWKSNVRHLLRMKQRTGSIRARKGREGRGGLPRHGER